MHDTLQNFPDYLSQTPAYGDYSFFDRMLQRQAQERQGAPALRAAMLAHHRHCEELGECPF